MQSSVDKRNGFTLIEIVVVLVLISIFATVAVWRQPRTEASVPACAGVLKAHIRYCQMRAMNTDSDWGIQYSRTGNYGLVRADDITTYYLLPGEKEKLVNLGAKGISVAPGAFLLTFNGWGVPKIVNGETSLFVDGNATIRLSKGETSKDITIIEKTGLVQ